MTEKLFQEDRYKIKESMIWDTYKKLPITPKLTEKECEVIIAHLNYHKEFIERKMKQHKNLYKNFVKLEEEKKGLEMKLKKSDKYRMVNLIGMDKNLWSIEDTSAKMPTYYNDIGRFENVKPVCDLLNELDMNAWYWEHSSDFWKRSFEGMREENEELKKEKEDWKTNCSNTINENSILWNEIYILMEQGAKPSQSFKEYLDSISTDYDKFWQRKLKKAKEKQSDLND